MDDLQAFLAALEVFEDALTAAVEARCERRLRSVEGRDAELMGAALATAATALTAREDLIATFAG